MNTPEAVFAALAHEGRLRCMVLLQREGELCVCELTHSLDLAQPVVSRHLAQLREAGWVEDRREGQWVHYRVNPQLPAWAKDVLAATAAGIAAKAPFANDRRRLSQMPKKTTMRGCA